MTATRYTVTRLPGAALRRAGRAWALGETLALGLSAAEVAALAADPYFRVATAATDGPLPTDTTVAAPARKRRRPAQG